MMRVRNQDSLRRTVHSLSKGKDEDEDMEEARQHLSVFMPSNAVRD